MKSQRVEDTDEETVERYVAAMERGDKFPAVLAWRDGRQLITIDGNHRLAAAERSQQKVRSLETNAWAIVLVEAAPISLKRQDRTSPEAHAMRHEPPRTTPRHRQLDAVRTALAVESRREEQSLRRVLVTAQLTSLMAPYAEAQHLRVEKNIKIGCEACGFLTADLVLSACSYSGQLGPEPLVAVDLRLPGDPVFARINFYMEHGAEEALIADPTDRSLLCYGLSPGLSRGARLTAC